MSRVLPIFFNTEMVRAILDGRKTATRRAVKYKYSNTEMKIQKNKYGERLIEIQKDVEGETHGKNPDGSTWRKLLGYIEPKPPYQPKDILYVRESVFQGSGHYLDITGEIVSYMTDDFEYYADGLHKKNHWKDQNQTIWMRRRPCIHMPKEAARIWLKVTDVRVERLQEITSKQILEEGANPDVIHHYIKQMPEETTEWIEAAHKIEFQQIWDSTIKKPDLDRYGWDANPWVWVIEFERCGKPESE